MKILFCFLLAQMFLSVHSSSPTLTWNITSSIKGKSGHASKMILNNVIGYATRGNLHAIIGIRVSIA